MILQWKAILGQLLQNANDKRPREKGTVIHYCQQCRLIQPLWKTLRRFLKKTKSRSIMWSSYLTSRIFKSHKNQHATRDIAYLCLIQHYLQLLTYEIGQRMMEAKGRGGGEWCPSPETWRTGCAGYISSINRGSQTWELVFEHLTWTAALQHLEPVNSSSWALSRPV